MADYEFELPFPPSINGYWRAFRNRQIISKKGREYRVEVLKRCKIIGIEDALIEENLSVSITLNPPTLRRYDVDNFCKSLLDGLTHAGFWIDDSQIQKLTIEKGIKTKGGNVIVKVNKI